MQTGDKNTAFPFVHANPCWGCNAEQTKCRNSHLFSLNGNKFTVKYLETVTLIILMTSSAQVMLHINWTNFTETYLTTFTIDHWQKKVQQKNEHMRRKGSKRLQFDKHSHYKMRRVSLHAMSLVRSWHGRPSLTNRLSVSRSRQVDVCIDVSNAVNGQRMYEFFHRIIHVLVRLASVWWTLWSCRPTTRGKGAGWPTPYASKPNKPTYCPFTTL